MDNLQLNALCEYEENLNGNLLLPEIAENKENIQILNFNEYINKINNNLTNFNIENHINSS